MSPTPEGLVKQRICIWLRGVRHKIGLQAFWINSSTGIWDAKRGIYRSMRSPFQRKGVSDILGFFSGGGRILALEVKTDLSKNLFKEVIARKTYATKEQQEFIDEVNTAGGVAGVVRGVEDVEALFQARGILK
jgi:hypothetical protein